MATLKQQLEEQKEILHDLIEQKDKRVDQIYRACKFSRFLEGCLHEDHALARRMDVDVCNLIHKLTEDRDILLTRINDANIKIANIVSKMESNN
jgi:hypothetical protein